jgi:hypothetical protein
MTLCQSAVTDARHLKMPGGPRQGGVRWATEIWVPPVTLPPIVGTAARLDLAKATTECSCPLPSGEDCPGEELYGKVYATMDTTLERQAIQDVARLSLNRSASDWLRHKPEETPIYESPDCATTIDYSLDLHLPGGGRSVRRDLSHLTLGDVVE